MIYYMLMKLMVTLRLAILLGGLEQWRIASKLTIKQTNNRMWRKVACTYNSYEIVHYTIYNEILIFFFLFFFSINLIRIRCVIYREPNKIYLAVIDRKFQTLEKRGINPIITINGLINWLRQRVEMYSRTGNMDTLLSNPSFSVSLLTRFHTH